MLKMMNTQKMWQWEERGRMAWVAGLLMQTKNKTEQIYKKFWTRYFLSSSLFVGLIVRLVEKKVGWLSSCLPKSQEENHHSSRMPLLKLALTTNPSGRNQFWGCIFITSKSMHWLGLGSSFPPILHNQIQLHFRKIGWNCSEKWLIKSITVHIIRRL